MTAPTAVFEFPDRLDRLKDNLRAQEASLRRVAGWFADTIGAGGCVHIYANGHSRITVEELCVRMGALTGFHPILPVVLSSFTDIVGPSGLRLNQAVEKVEGLGEKLLDEVVPGPGEPLIVVSATGQTQAAVDMALAWVKRHPENPLVVIASQAQASQAPAKHSSGQTLWHVAQAAKHAVFLDNGMPMGDVSLTVAGATGTYQICPLSSLGALSLVHSLNELTVRELDRRGVRPEVLQNMHLMDTRDTYDAWLRDQRLRYSRVLGRTAASS